MSLAAYLVWGLGGWTVFSVLGWSDSILVSKVSQSLNSNKCFWLNIISNFSLADVNAIRNTSNFLFTKT